MAIAEQAPSVKIPAVEIVPIDSLTVDGENPNRMSDQAFSALVESIRRYGFLFPIVTNASLLIADGEHKWRAGKELGMKEVPIVRLPVEEVDRKLLRQVLNKLRGQHDPTADAYEFQKIMAQGEADTMKRLLTLTNSQLERYLQRINPPKGEVYEFKPIEEYKTDIAPGDAFQLGDHRLICGDSTDPKTLQALLGDEKVHMIFTDPPYNVDYSAKNEFLNTMQKSNRITKPIEGDKVDNLQEFCEAFLNSAKPHLAEKNAYYITFAGTTVKDLLNALASTGYKMAQILIWKKNRVVLGRSDYHYTHELILYGWHGTHNFYGKAEKSVWEIDNPLASQLHPTMKPIKLCQRGILNSSQPGEIVLDLFNGSGSTLIACEQVGRKCRAVELDPRYCQITIDRWEHYSGRKAEQL